VKADQQRRQTQPEPAAPGARVTQLELFFDLVYVFAFLKVTTTSATYFGGQALLASFVLLALLWSAWSSFSLLGNTVRIDQGPLSLFAFATTAAVFVAAVSIPEAFMERPPGPPGPPGDLVFAAGYLVVQVLQLAAFRYATQGAPHRWANVGKLATAPLAATALLFLAALFGGEGPLGTTIRYGLWVLAVVVVYGAALILPVRGSTVVSASHWADRHAQIILVALGESVIALGIGPGLQAELPITWPVLGAVALGITLLAALWWAYFDVRAIAAERVLRRARGATRAALARDAYTYLHLLMVFGIILLALGIKRLLAAIADPAAANTRVAAHGIDPYVLYGGVVIYLVALFAFQVRTIRRLDPYSVVVVIVLTGLVAIAGQLPALATLALLTGAVVLGTAGQSLRTRQQRQKIRQGHLAEQRALEHAEAQIRGDHPDEV
jgi:low temperature requirement protein LtrA